MPNLEQNIFWKQDIYNLPSLKNENNLHVKQNGKIKSYFSIFLFYVEMIYTVWISQTKSYRL